MLNVVERLEELEKLESSKGTVNPEKGRDETDVLGVSDDDKKGRTSLLSFLIFSVMGE